LSLYAGEELSLNIYGGKHERVLLSTSHLLSDLKERLQELFDIAPHRQVLRVRESKLELTGDALPLSQFCLKPECVIDISSSTEQYVTRSFQHSGSLFSEPPHTCLCRLRLLTRHKRPSAPFFGVPVYQAPEVCFCCAVAISNLRRDASPCSVPLFRS
jgi:hypothetical protein